MSVSEAASGEPTSRIANTTRIGLDKQQLDILTTSWSTNTDNLQCVPAYANRCDWEHTDSDD